MGDSIVVIGSLNMDFVIARRPFAAARGNHSRTQFPHDSGRKRRESGLCSGETRQKRHDSADVGTRRERLIRQRAQDQSGQRGRRHQPGAGDGFGSDRRGMYPRRRCWTELHHGGARGEWCRCPRGDIHSQPGALAGARCVLLQLEVPIEAVAEGLREARRVGATSILDPAPARALPGEILQLVDIATPNENEACVLAGMTPSRVSPTDAVALGNKIRALGVRAVVCETGRPGLRLLRTEWNIRFAFFPSAGRGFHRGRRHV